MVGGNDGQPRHRLASFVSIAEIVSAAAVVITLAVLIIGVKGNTATIRAAAAAESRDTLAAMNEQDLMRSDDAIAFILRTQEPDTKSEDLNEIERFKATGFQRSFFRRAEAQFFRYRNGLLDEDIWQTVRHRVRLNITSPVEQQIWRRDHSSVYTAAFVEAIESYQPSATKSD